jgi:hypothetical protein
MNAAALPVRNKHWRWMSLLFVGLLPVFALFHLVMYFGFTRTLFREETGDLKRIGYLVGYEDRKEAMRADEPKTGFTLLTEQKQFENRQVAVMMFGDSFLTNMARAYSIRTGQPVGLGEVIWSQGNGLSQIESWLADDWFRQHGVKEIVVERVEYAWLDTFADKGDPALNIPWEKEQSGINYGTYQKATPWAFANNGNFKVLFSNLAYLISPTALKMTDTCVVRLNRTFFKCSYGDQLLFYRGDLRGALNKENQPRLETALKNLQELADICHQHGMKFHLIVPPVKSYLYYDWVEHPFYPDSKMLETLRDRATPYGYVDLKHVFHDKLASGYRDLYYPDDAHWNFPAAQMAAEELTKSNGSP